MRVYAHDRAVAGEYLDPLAVNRELRNLAARTNGLDRWAFAAAASLDKFPLGVWGKSARYSLTVAKTVVNAASTTLPSGAVAPTLGLFPIPNNAGDPWVELFTSDDGILEIDLTLWVERSTRSVQYRPGVLVDGRWKPFGPMSTWHGNVTGSEDCTLTFGSVPVGAGIHRLEPSVLCLNGGTLTFYDRQLAVREAIR